MYAKRITDTSLIKPPMGAYVQRVRAVQFIAYHFLATGPTSVYLPKVTFSRGVSQAETESVLLYYLQFKRGKTTRREEGKQEVLLSAVECIRLDQDKTGLEIAAFTANKVDFLLPVNMSAPVFHRRTVFTAPPRPYSSSLLSPSPFLLFHLRSRLQRVPMLLDLPKRTKDRVAGQESKLIRIVERRGKR